MPAGVIIGEAPTWKPTLVNRRAREIWQGSPPVAPDPGADPFAAGWPADWPLARSIATGEGVVDQEVDFVRPEGARIRLLVTSAPIRDREGRTISVVETFHDITARKRAEKAQQFLSRAGEQLARLGHVG